MSRRARTLTIGLLLGAVLLPVTHEASGDDVASFAVLNQDETIVTTGRSEAEWSEPS